MIVRIGNQYINLDNLSYTSDFNIISMTLFFSGHRSLTITNSEELKQLYEILETVRWERGKK